MFEETKEIEYTVLVRELLGGRKNFAIYIQEIDNGLSFLGLQTKENLADCKEVLSDNVSAIAKMEYDEQKTTIY